MSGTSLMSAARDFAESVGADAVVGMCVARNLPMRCIFAGAGMTMTCEDDEVHASRQLAADRAATGNRHALAA